jgi:hypothetical protein
MPSTAADTTKALRETYTALGGLSAGNLADNLQALRAILLIYDPGADTPADEVQALRAIGTVVDAGGTWTSSDPLALARQLLTAGGYGGSTPPDIVTAYRLLADAPPDTFAPAPAVLSNVVPGDNEIEFDIAFPDEGEDTMHVYRATSAGATTLLESVVLVVPPEARYIDATALNGTTYFYRVKLEDGAGNVSAYSNEVSGTPVAP